MESGAVGLVALEVLFGYLRKIKRERDRERGRNEAPALVLQSLFGKII